MIHVFFSNAYVYFSQFTLIHHNNMNMIITIYTPYTMLLIPWKTFLNIFNPFPKCFTSRAKWVLSSSLKRLTRRYLFRQCLLLCSVCNKLNLNTFHATSVSRRQVTNVIQIKQMLKNSGFWWIYLESLWETH